MCWESVMRADLNCRTRHRMARLRAALRCAAIGHVTGVMKTFRRATVFQALTWAARVKGLESAAIVPAALPKMRSEI